MKNICYFSAIRKTMVYPDNFRQKGIITPGICYTKEQQQRREKDPIVSLKTE